MKEQIREKKIKTEPKLRVELSEQQKAVPTNFYNYDISFVVGKWGSGKSLSAIHTAIVAKRKYGYDKIYITRPVVKNNLGILPGPQPLWCKVLTPNGWNTIKDIKIGDFVINKEGQPIKVVNKSVVNKEKYYKVCTTDGRTTFCAKNHLFFTQTKNDIKHYKDVKYGENYKGTVKSLESIINTFVTKNGKLNHYLPSNEAVEFNNIIPKIIHPYVLGCLLGDGSIINSICITNTDDELISKCRNILEKDFYTFNYQGGITYHIGDSLPLNNKVSSIYTVEKDGFFTVFKSRRATEKYTNLTDNEVCYYTNHRNRIKGYKITNERSYDNYTHRYKNELERLDLLGKKSYNKFIPKEYIYNASIYDRIELLRGLMDTDGTNDGTCSAYTTTSKQLALDIIELVRSLGGRSNFYIRDRMEEEHLFNNRVIKSNYMSYEVVVNIKDINPFYISRKQNRYKPKFQHLQRIKSIELCGEADVQCLLLESKDGLYITDDFIVTHNSIDDKMGPYMFPIIQNFEICQGKETTEKEFKDGKIEIIPVETAKGMTFVNSIVIVDEFEDFDKEDFITILTRLGKDSKMIWCGSKQQIHKTMLKLSCYPIVEELATSGLVGYVELEANFRNESLKPIMEYLENKKLI